jgi:HSP20 family protein
MNMGGFENHPLAQAFRAAFDPSGSGFGSQGQAGTRGAQEQEQGSDDFKPAVDIFDTPTAYIVHLALPGASKEDVGVNWNANDSSLNIAGVVYRPGDEEFLQTLVHSERKEVGAFERIVRLGTTSEPVRVIEEEISAKMEDGILRVTVPKVHVDEEEGFVSVRKVEIE